VASGPGGPSAAHETADDDLGADPGVDDADEDDAPVGAPPPYARPAPSDAPPTNASNDDDDEGAPVEPAQRRHRERDPDRMAAIRGDAPPRSREAAGPDAGSRPVRHRDTDAPEWERARPLEAYPTLRSRRLSELSIPPLLVAIVALALAAAVLFALPGLLGFGKPSAGESSAPTVPIATSLITPAPTPIPKPTDQVYVVQSGDTLSGIAKRFHIALADLIAANAETLPDPNKLAIGDHLIIPAKSPDQLPAASEIPAAT
jgi:nucleoid-associated protein YgaU